MPSGFVTQQIREFGVIMKARREELGMTQAQVARLVGVEEGPIVGSWERGAKATTLALALRWCEVLEMEFCRPKGAGDGSAAK